MSSRSSSRKKTKPKHFSRPDSAPLNRNTRDLWLTALQNGNGFSTESSGMNTISPRKADQNLAYNSTSTYLQQVMGIGKTTRMPDINSPRAAAGKPLYKSKEEYYDEVLQLRKEIGALKLENSTVKTKLRRLEEDNLKKEKELTGLLEPGKNEDFRRILSDRRPESFAVASSLKHKIMKLEAQLKAKEHAYLKLKNDLKTTKVEELQVQMETLYQEIARLQNYNSEQKSVKESGSNTKVKALGETVLHLNQSLEQLRNENQSLKEDLVEALENISQYKVFENTSPNKAFQSTSPNKAFQSASPNKAFQSTSPNKAFQSTSPNKAFQSTSPNKTVESTNPNKTVESVNQNKTNSEAGKDLEDMNQHELLTVIAEQKKIIKDLEKEKMVLENYLENKPRSNVPGKILVQGSVTEQLEQLDKQETHLLEELQKLKDHKKQTKGERNHYKKKSEEFELECQKLQLTIKELELQLKLDNNKATHSSVKRRSRVSPSPDIRNSRRNSKTRHTSTENTKNINQEEEEKIFTQTPQVTNNEEVLKLREKHAAKCIQKAWRQHDADKQDIVTIQAMLSAHAARKKFLKQAEKGLEAAHRQSEVASLDEAVELIQSTLRAHHSRNKQQQQIFKRENFMMETIVQS